jgi:hypothetical protein
MPATPVPFTAGRWLVPDVDNPVEHADTSALEDATQDQSDSVLEELDRLWIRGEFTRGPDTTSLDNVSIG